MLISGAELPHKWSHLRLVDLCYSVLWRLAVLNLDSLHVRRIKADLLLCYKMINNLVDVDVSAFSHCLTVNLLEAMGVN